MATVDEIQTQNLTHILAFQQEVKTALESVSKAGALPFLSWYDFVTTPAPDLPKISPINLKDYPRITLEDLPQLQQASLGTASTSQIDKTDFMALQAKVMALVDSLGQDMAPEVQDAIIKQGTEREKQLLLDALDLARANTGAVGCRRPNSMTAAAEQEINLNYFWKKSDQSREIIKVMADIAQKNLAMSINAGVAVNQSLAEISIKNLTYLLEAQKLIYDKFKVETEAYVSTFTGQLNALVVELEAQIKSETLQLDAEKTAKVLQANINELLLKKYQVGSNVIIEKGKAQITQAEEANKLKMEALKQIATSYGELMKSLSAQAVSIVTKKT
jgi:hypothetical protein